MTRSDSKPATYSFLTDGKYYSYNSSRSVGSRYSYVLNIDDIKTYLGQGDNEELNYSGLTQMCLNTVNGGRLNNVGYNSAGHAAKYTFLRAVRSDDVWVNVVMSYNTNKQDMVINQYGVDNAIGIQPAFVVNLSQVDFEVVDSNTITSTTLGF